jgi:hypothetical protein
MFVIQWGERCWMPICCYLLSCKFQPVAPVGAHFCRISCSTITFVIATGKELLFALDFCYVKMTFLNASHSGWNRSACLATAVKTVIAAERAKIALLLVGHTIIRGEASGHTYYFGKTKGDRSARFRSPVSQRVGRRIETRKIRENRAARVGSGKVFT